MKFYFDTGVRPNHFATPPIIAREGQVVKGGTIQIPFECDDVPIGSTFLYACDGQKEEINGIIKREIKNSVLISKFAYFRLPSKK